MTRTATTKLVATALAVASLGLASTAQAADQSIAIGEPTPGAGVPAQPAGPAQPAEQGMEEGNQAEEDTPKTKEQQQIEDAARYERYCNQPNAEPSHSDKAFCEAYAKGTNASADKQPTTEERDRYERYCKMKDAEPSHSDKEFCRWYEERYPEHGTDKPDYERTDDYEEAQPAAKKVEKADKGSLPFTGLEIWQLGLIGIVLVGGGFGARRLLAS